MKPRIKPITSAAGKVFFGWMMDASCTRAVIFLSVSFVPVRTNFVPGAGACGAMIFWKQVGQSMTLPACDSSHIMCWPQMGHANLNSLMASDGQNISQNPPFGNALFVRNPPRRKKICVHPRPTVVLMVQNL